MYDLREWQTAHITTASQHDKLKTKSRTAPGAMNAYSKTTYVLLTSIVEQLDEVLASQNSTAKYDISTASWAMEQLQHSSRLRDTRGRPRLGQCRLCLMWTAAVLHSRGRHRGFPFLCRCEIRGWWVFVCK